MGDQDMAMGGQMPPQQQQPDPRDQIIAELQQRLDALEEKQHKTGFDAFSMKYGEQLSPYADYAKAQVGSDDYDLMADAYDVTNQVGGDGAAVVEAMIQGFIKSMDAVKAILMKTGETEAAAAIDEAQDKLEDVSLDIQDGTMDSQGAGDPAVGAPVVEGVPGEGAAPAGDTPMAEADAEVAGGEAAIAAEEAGESAPEVKADAEATEDAVDSGESKEVEIEDDGFGEDDDWEVPAK
jgi:hypothetical protein